MTEAKVWTYHQPIPNDCDDEMAQALWPHAVEGWHCDLSHNGGVPAGEPEARMLKAAGPQYYETQDPPGVVAEIGLLPTRYWRVTGPYVDRADQGAGHISIGTE